MEQETCCPGNKDCTREQPPRLFRIGDDGCWAVALKYLLLEDGRIEAEEYHLLADENCQWLSAREA